MSAKRKSLRKGGGLREPYIDLQALQMDDRGPFKDYKGLVLRNSHMPMVCVSALGLSTAAYEIPFTLRPVRKKVCLCTRNACKRRLGQRCQSSHGKLDVPRPSHLPLIYP